jgi:hypothetical protein
MSNDPPHPQDGITTTSRGEDRLSPPAFSSSTTPTLPRRPSFWRRHGATALVAGTVAAVVSAAVCVFALNQRASPGGRLVQEGKVRVVAGGTFEVFYPAPFDSPPHLQLDGENLNWHALKLDKQQAAGFTLRSTADTGGPVEVRWRAEGIRIGR